MSNSTKVAVQITDLQRVFKLGDTDVHALRGIDLEIKKGEFNVILGPSGSSKTTFLKMVGQMSYKTMIELNLINFYEV